MTATESFAVIARAAQKPSLSSHSSNHLESLSQSPEKRVAKAVKISSPDTPSNRNIRQPKIVHWDPNVVENGHKNSKSASLRSLSTTSKNLSKKTLESPAQRPSSSSLTASKKLSKKRLESSAPRSKQVTQANRHQFEFSCKPNPHSHSEKSHPLVKHRSSDKSRTVPPRVPEPPRRQGPPPTPKPARLPTPDLPDIGDFQFCGCPFGYHCIHNWPYDPRDTQGLPTYLKMDARVEAAIAHIKGRQGRPHYIQKPHSRWQ